MPDRFLAIEHAFRQGASSGLKGELDYEPDCGTEDLPGEELRAVAYEGLSMGLTARQLQDPLSKNIWPKLLQSPAARYSVLIHVGKGMAFARFQIRWTERRPDMLAQSALLDGCMLDGCMLDGFMLDGYGFYFGYHSGSDYIAEQSTEYRPSDNPLAKIFDQGLGRSIWFHSGANLPLSKEIIQAFMPERQPDLWTGLGLACAYAGGGNAAEMRDFANSDFRYLPYFATGAIIAGWIRQNSSCSAGHTEEVLSLVTGDAEKKMITAADKALHLIPPEQEGYLYWQTLIREAYSKNHVSG